MIELRHFTFNPFQENTVVLSDETGECVIIDPGCYDGTENTQLEGYITENDFLPVRLLNTHCHIDHIFGNKFVSDRWGLGLEMHEADLPTLRMAARSAELYGLNGYIESPMPSNFLKETDVVEFGNSTLEIRFVPGHAPGHIAFISHVDKLVIGGDVLFRGSIGRTDLPGGDYDQLIESIKTQFLTLPDDYLVICGHGPHTSIRQERMTNPFLKEI